MIVTVLAIVVGKGGVQNFEADSNSRNNGMAVLIVTLIVTLMGLRLLELGVIGVVIIREVIQLEVITIMALQLLQQQHPPPSLALPLNLPTHQKQQSNSSTATTKQ